MDPDDRGIIGYTSFMRPIFLLLLAACVWTPSRGCGGGTSGFSSPDIGFSRFDSGTSTDETGGGACSIEVLSTFPKDNSIDFYHRDSVYFYLNHASEEVVVETNILGSSQYLMESSVLQFTPDAPLEPLTDYTVSLFFCSNLFNLTFKTSEFGQPMSDSLGATRWLLKMSSARTTDSWSAYWAKNLGSLALEASDSLRIASLQPGVGTQDWCTATNEAPLVTADLPAFSASFDTLPLSVNPAYAYAPPSNVLLLHNVVVEGSFSPDATDVYSMLTGTMDLRDMNATKDQIKNFCSTMSAGQNECVACDDGIENCVRMKFEFIERESWSGEIVPVAGNNCEACLEGPPAADAVCAN